MDFADEALTTGAVVRFTLLVAVVDISLILGIHRVYSEMIYQRLSRWIAVISFIFYAALWTSVLTWAWDWFYIYVFPPWMHYFGLAWGIAYSGAGWGMWWLSQRLPGKPAVNFCLLGMLEGFLTHLWAIYGAGAVSKPPIMQGVDPETVLVFAVFEKCFYWIVILLLAGGLSQFGGIIRRRWLPQ